METPKTPEHEGGMAAQGGARPDPEDIAGVSAVPTGGPPTTAEKGATVHLRVTRGRFEPATYDEFVRLSQDIATAVRRLPGCRSYHGGLDRAAGRLVAVSTWDRADQARFSRDALGEVLTRTLALGAQLEPPEFYEVVA